jgi:hypothetical protein
LRRRPGNFPFEPRPFILSQLALRFQVSHSFPVRLERLFRLLLGLFRLLLERGLPGQAILLLPQKLRLRVERL